MLTLKKIKIYKRYNRSVDLFNFASKRAKKILSEEDIKLIDDLIQDLTIMINGNASKSFIDKVNKKLEVNGVEGEIKEQLLKIIKKEKDHLV